MRVNGVKRVRGRCVVTANGVVVGVAEREQPALVCLIISCYQCRPVVFMLLCVLFLTELHGVP